jgi:hypothetical protein
MNRLWILSMVALLLVAPSLVQAESTPIKIGDVTYSIISMGFKPAINGTVIETGEDSLTFQLNQTGGISIAAFVNSVSVNVTTPSNVTVPVKSVSNFAVALTESGNYTITFHWGSWIPLIGRVLERFTGSGDYKLTIVKKAPFPVTTVLMVAGGIAAAVVIVIVLGRKVKGKVWQK